MAKADQEQSCTRRVMNALSLRIMICAIDLYSSALAQDPSLLECYAATAQAYIRSENMTSPKREADRGIDVLRGISAQNTDSKPSDELKKCLRGVEWPPPAGSRRLRIHSGRLKSWTISDKGITQWMTWV